MQLAHRPAWPCNCCKLHALATACIIRADLLVDLLVIGLVLIGHAQVVCSSLLQKSRPQGSRGRRLARSLARKSQVVSCARLFLWRAGLRQGRPFILVCERAPPKTWERQREKTERLGEKNKDKTTAIIVLRYQRGNEHKAQETRVLCYIDHPSFTFRK